MKRIAAVVQDQVKESLDARAVDGGVAQIEEQDPEAANESPPAIIVAPEPTELISSDGKPEYSPIGDTDLLFVERVSPPLTTIAVDYREMGAAAARQLLDLVGEEGEGSIYPPVQLAPSLVVRASTAPPPER